MNSIRQIQELNRRELENGVTPEASWHADYRDTAYIYIGGLPFELSEGDVVTIFSQYGEPTYINLIRDKETGKSKGFAFLKYEDQRSTDLAVDNLGGAVIMNRTLKVDHTRYKKRDDEEDTGQHLDRLSDQPEDEDGKGRRKRRKTSESDSEDERRPMLKEERELAKLIQEQDEDDPMKAYLIQEKKEEVALALARVKGGKDPEKARKHRHHHHHRSRHPKEDDKGGESSQRSRHGKDSHSRRRAHSGGEDDDGRSRRREEPERSDGYGSRRRSPRAEYGRDQDGTWRRDRSREDRHRSTRDSRD